MAKGLYYLTILLNFLFGIALRKRRRVSMLFAYFPLLMLNLYTVYSGASVIGSESFLPLFIIHVAALIEEYKAFVMFLQHFIHRLIVFYKRNTDYANTLGMLDSVTIIR